MKSRMNSKPFLFTILVAGLMLCSSSGIADGQTQSIKAKKPESALLVDNVTCVDGITFIPDGTISAEKIQDYLICKGSPMTVDMPVVIVDKFTGEIKNVEEPGITIELDTIGMVFIFYGALYHVDARYLVAMSGSETTFGSSSCLKYPLFNIHFEDPNDYINHNPLNYFRAGANLKEQCLNSYFKSWAEGIKFAAELLSLT
jgi:hypothetical protein